MTDARSQGYQHGLAGRGRDAYCEHAEGSPAWAAFRAGHRDGAAERYRRRKTRGRATIPVKTKAGVMMFTEESYARLKEALNRGAEAARNGTRKNSNAVGR